ncbi:DUF5050 domain-containing protein [Cohnella yongneupensis]|uniref:DUF5050 domain-containing protein n=1 Tax=Cohnella yongneupensis TaxID=425006 RepID=A0ABW0R0Y0_9BACL
MRKALLLALLLITFIQLVSTIPPVSGAGSNNVGAAQASGGLDTLTVVKTADGSIWTAETPSCWGVLHRDDYVKVQGLQPIAKVDSGYSHILALSDSGEVYAWGCNTQGELGQGNRVENGNPVLVPGLSRIRDIAAGLYSSVAVDEDDTLWFWGAPKLYSPHPLKGYHPTTISVDSNGFKATMKDGTLWYGSYDSYDDEIDMYRVEGVTDAVAVSSEANFSLVLKKDGTVWNIKGGRLIPIPGLNDITAISAGDGRGLALDKQGTLWSWEQPRQSLLGFEDSDVIDPISPKRVPGLSNVVSFDAGYTHSYAITANQTMYIWGKSPFTDSKIYPGTMDAPTRVPLPKSEIRLRSLNELFNYASINVQNDALYFYDDLTYYEMKPKSLIAQSVDGFVNGLNVYGTNSVVANRVLSQGKTMDRTVGDWIYFYERKWNEPMQVKRMKADGTKEAILIQAKTVFERLKLDYLSGDWIYYHDASRQGSTIPLLRKNVKSGKTETVIARFYDFGKSAVRVPSAVMKNWNNLRYLSTIDFGPPYFENDSIYYVADNVFYKAKLDGSGKKSLSKTNEKIAYGTLTMDNDSFYFWGTPNNMYKAAKDGTKLASIASNVTKDTSLRFAMGFVQDGWLYYSDSDLYKIKTDGKQKTKILDVADNERAVIAQFFNAQYRIDVYRTEQGSLLRSYLYDAKKNTMSLTSFD